MTPDPGVIEVNIQPSKDWESLSRITKTIYEEANKVGLTTQKFMLDGRASGTGGGNHITLGAEHPSDSPFLRRPSLLKSMICFWQNHPSLSYLFSSWSIGPTSQSPRIDEARMDSLYELQIAFEQMPQNENIPPWLVDRLFRNILVDLTGNTHRTEFCIDKLYGPDTNRGRLGLLEIRSLEMTPHYQMNLLQGLLIRALISTFWNKPYHHKLVRWGTALHDKFMLPYFVFEDFKEVIQTLNIEGLNFNLDWFYPFFEFRFPKYGHHKIDQLEIELRMALEPWPVMGEEASGGSVSRSVDSSVERLQVKIEGILGPHLILVCNGRRVPLHRTTKNDTYVAGIRFKAWNPYSCLHPTIPIHSPLVFDIIDTRYNRSIGGCTYHVMHPGGRNYDSIPINENEAEGRRLSRFINMGHTPGFMPVPNREINEEFPHTLDLRKFSD